MSALFQGTYTNKIDAKGRVSIPAPLRRVLEKNDPDWNASQNTQLSILYGLPGKKCLEVFSVNSMNEMLEKVQQLPSRSTRRDVLSRLFASNSQPFQLDENGRLLIPKNLLETAGIEGEVVFSGMIERFEIWNPDQFNADNEHKFSWFNENGDMDDPLAGLI